jgi:hypothetical protein
MEQFLEGTDSLSTAGPKFHVPTCGVLIFLGMDMEQTSKAPGHVHLSLGHNDFISEIQESNLKLCWSGLGN